ncbi:LOW QUALITY PROTEIN: hypothetical protein PHMEG_00010411 [Phytophthora megakarya]|uniref:Uncharacterized protein n=1 Tax=Phytophthora megakarya TaxID=4795 RepID=A0A225WDR8_9STRA|nr:LOW QUALITY PROTEIN: hypothetical protein PHMEG_00010411 [Phytophthora megakarya]
MTTESAASSEKDCVFTQRFQSTSSIFADLDDSLTLAAPPTKGSLTTRLNPSLLYAQLSHELQLGKKKRVHLKDEVPDGTTTAEATEASTEDSTMQVQRPIAEVRPNPTAHDIDPVSVQEERIRRIVQAQDEDLRRSNPKAI